MFAGKRNEKEPKLVVLEVVGGYVIGIFVNVSSSIDDENALGRLLFQHSSTVVRVMVVTGCRTVGRSGNLGELKAKA